MGVKFSDNKQIRIDRADKHQFMHRLLTREFNKKDLIKKNMRYVLITKKFSSLHVHDWFEAVFISHEKYDTKIKKEI